MCVKIVILQLPKKCHGEVLRSDMYSCIAQGMWLAAHAEALGSEFTTMPNFVGSLLEFGRTPSTPKNAFNRSPSYGHSDFGDTCFGIQSKEMLTHTPRHVNIGNGIAA